MTVVRYKLAAMPHRPGHRAGMAILRVEVETAELPPGVLVRVSTVDDLGDRRVEPDERPFGDVDTALAHVGAWLRAWVGDG